jgi:glutamate 5-kinase
MKKAITLDRSSLLSNRRRIVIKVGSAVLASSESGLDQVRIERLASEISDLLDKGREVILVSSGAIAAGFAKLGLTKKKGLPLSVKQAAAAGQPTTAGA